jgi:hypothetical protein
MRYLINCLFVGLMTFVYSAGAGEGHGHSHDAPGVIKAQRGGRIQPALAGLLVELVVDKTKNTIKLYPTNAEYKAVPLKEVQITATTQRRRVDKSPTPLKLEEQGDHFVGSFDPQNRFPYNVDVKTLYKGQADGMQFIVDRN